MSEFLELERQAALDSLESLGEEILIQGLTHKAIFRDSEYEDEQGVRKELSIQVLNSVISDFKKNDNVLIRNTNFVIKRIPKVSDVLVTIDLRRPDA